MSRLICVLLTCVFSLLLLTACPEQSPGVTTDYTSSNSGQTITLKPGDTFTVGLFSAPSTAYFWEVIELDTAVVRNVSNEYVPNPETRGEAGGGGKDIWKFEAVAAGTTTLKMENARTTEPREPRDDFELIINVTGSWSASARDNPTAHLRRPSVVPCLPYQVSSR